MKIILDTFIKAVHAETSTLWYYDKLSTGKIYAKTTYDDVDLSNSKLNIGQGIAGSVIKYTLNRLDLNKTDKNTVLTDFMDIYKVLYK